MSVKRHSILYANFKRGYLALTQINAYYPKNKTFAFLCFSIDKMTHAYNNTVMSAICLLRRAR